jgi:hypothetical protein
MVCCKEWCWRVSQTSSLLWVSADPGCRKSVLSKSLIDRELQNAISHVTCFFSFKEDDPDQRTLNNALCALLHQLFSKNRALLRHAVADFEVEKSYLPELPNKL